MLHKSIKFVYAVMVLFSCTMAFLVTQILDEVAITGVTGVVRIDESENTAGGAQVTAMVEEFARDNRINVGRELADVRHPEGLRHLYLAVGDPDSDSAAWLTDGYPGFSRNVHTEVHPFSDVGDRDPRGYYYLFGPADKADDLRHAFAELGLHGWQAPSSTLQRALQYFGHGALLWCVIIMALVVVLAVGSGVILSTRLYGIQRLHGHSPGRVLGQDLTGLGWYLARVVVVVAGVVTALLFSYNGLHQVRAFALTAAGFFVAFAALALTVHVLTFALVYRIDLVGSLKGEVPAGWTMGTSYAIRIPALVVALYAAVSLIAANAELRSQRSEAATWAQAGDAVYVLLNGSLGSETTELEDTVGRWIRESGERGEVIIARQESRGGSPLSAAGGDSGRNVITVNSTYLREQPVLDPDGRRIAGPAEGVVQVLIPQARWDERDRISALVQEWATFVVGTRPVPAPSVRAVPMRDGQSLFTYNVSAQLDRSPRLDDPLVVVVPDGSEILSDADYTAYATQNGVIFRDGGYVRDSLDTGGLGEYVLAVNPVAENAANQYRAAVREFRLRAFNLVATLVVLIITALSVALIYSRKRAQSLFVKYICGWSFTRAYRSVLVAEAAIAAMLVGWSLVQFRPKPPDAAAAPGPRSAERELVLDGWERLVAVGIALAGLCFVLAALGRFNAKMIRERSAQV